MMLNKAGGSDQCVLRTTTSIKITEIVLLNEVVDKIIPQINKSRQFIFYLIKIFF